MAAKNGSFSFDFEGIYTDVKDHELIAYTLGDGRKVSISFSSEGQTTYITDYITETFEPEQENSIEMQQKGWQTILDNFKKYTERSF